MRVDRHGLRGWIAAAMLAVAVVVPVSRSVRAEIAGGATTDPSGAAVATRAAMGYVDAGDAHTCVVTAAWSVVCVGSGLDGRLGTGSTSDVGDDPSETGAALQAVPLGTGRTARAVATGDAHTCALLDDGRVKCWGGNGNGQLGLGDSNARGDGPGEMGDALPSVNLGTGRTAIAIAAGGNHTCAVLDDGRVKCWGVNSSGQLGISSTAARGRKASEMGDSLPVVAMPGGRPAIAVAAGDDHTCAILDDASLACWGEGVGGRLGQGSEARIGDDPSRAVASSPVVSLPRPVVAVAAGRFHSCAVLDDATLRCWGTGLDGRLGTGSTDARGDQPGEMGASLPAIDVGASRGVRAVAAGGSHTCAILDDATLRCFGFSYHGQLGSGSTASIGDQLGEMGGALVVVPVGSVVAVTAGSSHTCVLRWGGGMRCVGNGANGRLATGGTASIGDQSGEVAALGDAGTPSPATVPTTTSTTSTTTTTVPPTTTTTTTTVPPTTTTSSTTTSTVAPTTTTSSTTTTTTTVPPTTTTTSSTTTTTSSTIASTTTAGRSSGGGDDRRTTTSSSSTVAPVGTSASSVVLREVQAAVTALPPFPLGQKDVRGPVARELARWAATVPPGSVVRCTAVGGTSTALPSLALARARAVCAAVAALGHRTVVEVLPVRTARIRWRRSGAAGPLPPDALRRILVEVADGTGR